MTPPSSPTEGFAGAIFDVDGVLVDSPHERAWRESLRRLMEGDWRALAPRTRYTPEVFTHDFYQEVMAGKPRMAGARAALERLGVPHPGPRTREYATEKQRRVVELISAGEFHAFPDALAFLLATKHAGLRIACASSSRTRARCLSASGWTSSPSSVACAFPRSARASPCWTPSTPTSPVGTSRAASPIR
jgi:beta-phosphoglucomutase-like phosphatase (HAD superfamily)